MPFYAALPCPSTLPFHYPCSAEPSALFLALRSAQVVLLTRNVVLTGDDFSHVGGATLGLHVVGMYGGSLRVEHTRVEKCGQRGVLGKYCLHFHLLGRCAACRLAGNAIEWGMQRGIVIHGTHEATVEANVVYDVRAAHHRTVLTSSWRPPCAPTTAPGGCPPPALPHS